MTDKTHFYTNLGKETWWNGKLIPTESANLHVSAHTLHYGLGTFEGIRAYAQKDESLGIFRLAEHMQRFLDSSHIGGLPQPYPLEQLMEGSKDTARASGFKSCYLRPIGFLDAGPLGITFKPEHPYTVAILSADWGRYLGADVTEKGARIKISSFTRHHPNVSMTKAKLCGNYINSILSNMEAKKLGFDEALLLDPEGYVAEGAGENLFVIKNDRVITPSVESVLAGITRDSIKHILEDMGLGLSERRLSRDELYCADELFFVGTAAEVTPIRELDMKKIGTGAPGKLTKEIQKRYFEIVRGENKKYQKWITIV